MKEHYEAVRDPTFCTRWKHPTQNGEERHGMQATVSHDREPMFPGRCQSSKRGRTGPSSQLAGQRLDPRTNSCRVRFHSRMAQSAAKLRALVLATTARQSHQSATRTLAQESPFGQLLALLKYQGYSICGLSKSLQKHGHTGVLV